MDVGSLPVLVARLRGDGADVAGLVGGALQTLVAATAKGYMRMLRRWAEFAASAGRAPWPVSEGLASRFVLEELVPLRARPASIVSSFCSAVALLAVCVGVDDPLGAPLFRRFRQGAVRGNTSAPREPRRIVDLRVLNAALAAGSVGENDFSAVPLEELRTRAMVVLQVFALARPSDVAAARRERMSGGADGSLRVRLAESKGDRARDGSDLVVRAPSRAGMFNPVMLVWQYFGRTMGVGGQSGPLFLTFGTRVAGVRAGTVAQLTKLFGLEHGMPAYFTSACLRPSVVSKVRGRGADAAQVQRAGRWRNLATMLNYYDGSEDLRLTDRILAD